MNRFDGIARKSARKVDRGRGKQGYPREFWLAGLKQRIKEAFDNSESGFVAGNKPTLNQILSIIDEWAKEADDA